MQSAFSQEEPSSIQRMFARIAPRYDLANTLLSLGMDALWRRRVGRAVAAWNPADVLDLATGSGALALEILQESPGTRLVGADFCLPMLVIARQRGIKELVAADGLALPFGENQFDAVTVAFGLRNMASWETALGEMRRVLRQSGHVLILDFSLPKRPLLPFYRFYLHRILPKLAGWVTGTSEAYQYFGDSIEAFPKGETMLELMARCGFVDCQATPLSCGIVTVYTGKKP